MRAIGGLLLAGFAAAPTSAPPGHCQITGWWSGGTGIVQVGDKITIGVGDTGHGSIAGHKLTMYLLTLPSPHRHPQSGAG